MISGGPKYCLGYYGPDQTKPFGYTSFYWCDGQWAVDSVDGKFKPVAGTGKAPPPGSTGRMGWNNTIDFGIHYKPAFADRKLEFSFDVFNLLNSQTVLNRWWTTTRTRPVPDRIGRAT